MSVNKGQTEKKGLVEAVLVIYISRVSDYHPWRRDWQQIRFVKPNDWDKKNIACSWLDLVESGAIDNLTRLIDQEGVLVKQTEEIDGYKFASHMALVEKFISAAGNTTRGLEVHCAGEYFELETWCID